MAKSPISEHFRIWWKKANTRNKGTMFEVAFAAYRAGFQTGKRVWEEDYRQRSIGSERT